jgi:ribosomal protein L2
MAGLSSRRSEFGGEAPTLSPAARMSPGRGQRGELLVEHRGQERRAANRLVDAVERPGGRLELAVEVVEPHDRDRPDRVAAFDDVEQDSALAVLRLRDAQQVGERGRQVD